MHGVGVIEGFFGPEWSWQERYNICQTIGFLGGRFYIYAPKRDAYLRKLWTEQHPTSTWENLKKLRQQCKAANLKFGIGLSPFEIYNQWNQKSKEALKKKLEYLQELEVDYLGLFFDDMKGSPNLADIQVEIIDYTQLHWKIPILFCPTYYSEDIILDRVFGERPKNYLETISKLSQKIEIFWTGNKVISNEITAEHLVQVAHTLKRKPFIWDNYYANDGPKQCQYLKLKPYLGRSPTAFQHSSGWALNLMNQPNLSEILLSAAIHTLLSHQTPEQAWDLALSQVNDTSFKTVVQQHFSHFNTQGLTLINPTDRSFILQQLSSHRFSEDILNWFSGKYNVGPECLTD